MKLGRPPPEGGFDLAHLLPHQVSVVAGVALCTASVAQGEAAPGGQVAEHQALLSAVGGGGVVVVAGKAGGHGLVAQGWSTAAIWQLTVPSAVGLALAALRAGAGTQRAG